MDKADQLPAYQYQSLPQGWIRVIEIESSVNDSDPIYCRMIHVQLDGWDYHQAYMTLSYVWGSTSQDGSHLAASVRCDGRTIRITSNLHAALKHVRRHKKALDLVHPLWADGLCINQDDPVERSHQVQLMPTIYSVSHLLLIWLGTDLPIRRNEPLTQQVLERLTDNNWFRRRWTVQEYNSTPSDRRFFLVDDMLLWADTIQTRLRSHNLVHKAGPMRRAGHLEQYSPWLIQNLVTYANAQCSDEHDIVYALRSISADGEALKVDYTLSAQEALSNAAVLCIGNAVKSIMLLSCATAWRSGHVHGDISASWVPDWRVAPHYIAPEHEEAVDKTLKWSSDSLKGRGLEITQSGNYLRAKGYFIGPCFPPLHVGAESELDCPCCKICGAWWSGWSTQLRESLERIDASEGQLLLVRYGASAWVIYVLAVGSESETYQAQSCFLVGDFTPSRVQQDGFRETWFGWAGKCQRLAREMEASEQYLKTVTIV